MRAIIVDDEQMAIENLRMKLSGDERISEIETFRSPVKALDYLRENDADIAFLDINMPVMDGLTATAAIRAMERADAKKIPVIALTANAFDEDVNNSLEAGMNTHLSKPVEPERLYSVLSELIHNNER